MKLILSVHIYNVMITGSAAEVEELKAKVYVRFVIFCIRRAKKHLGMMYSWEIDHDGPYIIISMAKKLRILYLSTINTLEE